MHGPKKLLYVSTVWWPEMFYASLNQQWHYSITKSQIYLLDFGTFADPWWEQENLCQLTRNKFDSWLDIFYEIPVLHISLKFTVNSRSVFTGFSSFYISINSWLIHLLTTERNLKAWRLRTWELQRLFAGSRVKVELKACWGNHLILLPQAQREDRGRGRRGEARLWQTKNMHVVLPSKPTGISYILTSWGKREVVFVLSNRENQN